MAEASRSRVAVKLEAAGDTHIGGRTHNEDAILLRPDLNLYVVADGAGGQNAGNVAASLATTSLAHFFEQIQPSLEEQPEHDRLGLYHAARRLSIAVQEANREILEIAKTSDRHHGMGTTVVAALFVSAYRRVHVAQVGDSRFYRLRDGRLELLTHDHSLANDVLEMRPEIADARLMKLPQNVITRALGMSEKLRVSVRTHELVHGDRYLLCSDGLSDVVAESQIAEVLGLGASCDERVRLLVDLAIEGGADDNVAVIVLDTSLAAGKATSAVRLNKKLTPPRMARIEAPARMQPSRDSLTDESVPEIVLFDDASDSSPMIHVVPLDSASSDMVDAVSDVIVPPNRRASTSSRAPVSDAPPRPARPTMAYTAFERGGAAADPGSAISVPRREKLKSAGGPNRTGQTAQPPKPTLSGSATSRAARPAVPPPDDVDDPPTAELDAASSSKPEAPRPRTTKEGPPPLPNAAQPLAKKGRLNLPAARGKKRKTPAPAIKTSAKPFRDSPSNRGRAKAPTPAPRELLDTNEFVGEETKSCHACGSFISTKAEICLYCGAPTGFVIRADKS